MSILVRLPWDSQPQEAAEVNRNSWQARDLSLWYPLNGNALDPVKSNLGILHSGAGFAASQRGRVAFFDGSDDYMSWPGSLLGTGNNFTFSAWVYYSGALGSRATVWGCENAATTFQLEVGGGAGGATTGGVTAIYSGAVVGSTGNSVLAANTWTHIVYIKRGTGATSEFYINGVQTTSASNVALDYSETFADRILGRRAPGTQLFSGMLQDVRINNFAMSAEQVGDLYRNGLDLFAPRSVWVPVSAGGGGTTISATLGAAAAAGFTAGINANTTVAASLGTVVASGFTATINANRTLATNLGTAVASGLTASVTNSTDTTISAGLGTATASGFMAVVNAGNIIVGTLGVAAASGFNATISIGGATAVSCGLGEAIASGLTASVTSAYTYVPVYIWRRTA